MQQMDAQYLQHTGLASVWQLRRLSQQKLTNNTSSRRTV
jgi:hypothetical protein